MPTSRASKLRPTSQLGVMQTSEGAKRTKSHLQDQPPKQNPLLLTPSFPLNSLLLTYMMLHRISVVMVPTYWAARPIHLLFHLAGLVPNKLYTPPPRVPPSRTAHY
jgi:hypothetical protein